MENPPIRVHPRKSAFYIEPSDSYHTILPGEVIWICVINWKSIGP